jgi:hypothetical protein
VNILRGKTGTSLPENRYISIDGRRLSLTHQFTVKERQPSHLVRFTLFVTSFVCCAILGSIAPARSALAQQASALTQVVSRHDDGTCAGHYWLPNRGHAPKAFVQGTLAAYRRAYCQLQAPGDSTAKFVAGTDFKPGNDALVLYGKNGGTESDRLRALYALSLGEGMMESSGNPSVGFDTTVKHQTPQIAEAGLFQVSYDSIDKSPWLRTLYKEYQEHPDRCELATFMNGQRDHNATVVGDGAPGDFQKFTKACPAFALEYAAIMFRVDMNHFGPVKHQKAELLPQCEALLRAAEPKAGESCE